VVTILWDVDSDGPDFTDPPVPTAPDPNGDPRPYFNYCYFLMNGSELGLGPGLFYAPPFCSNGGLLTPNRIYLRICLPSIRYESLILSLAPGPSEIRPSWTCTAAPCEWDIVPPPIALNVQASTILCDYVQVAWSYSTSTGLDSFLIKRNGVRVGAVAPSATPGNMHFNHYTMDSRWALYTVVGWNNLYGEGEPSDADSGRARQLPGQVTGVTASDTICCRIVVSWNACEQAASYRIYRGLAGNPNMTLLYTVYAPQTTYEDVMSQPYTAYRYQIQAVNVCGEGPMSEFAGGSHDFPLGTIPQVVASDGTYGNMVVVTWDNHLFTNTARGYKIVRRYASGEDPDTFYVHDPNESTYQDLTARPGFLYDYCVLAFNYCGNGQSETCDTGYRVCLSAAGQEAAAADFRLYPNYPNPFNARTRIEFDLPHSENVRLSVFDIAGRTVAILADGMMNAGHHQLDFNAANLPSGVYILRMDASEFTATQKLLLLK